MKMCHELQYSGNWTEYFGLKGYVYMERPSRVEWEMWRDLKFDTELDHWCWVIDFWMGNGNKWNNRNGNTFQDEECGTNISDCSTVIVVAF